MTWIWIFVLGLPLLLALMIPFGGRIRRIALELAPFAAVPAFLASLRRDPAEPVLVDWLLLGSRLGLDQVSQLFLLVTALLWAVAGIYARAYHAADPGRYRFFFYYLLTMSGNLGLVLAGDVITFYAAFALMTFSAYGLVVHTRTAQALRAGRIYILLAVLGEAFLLAGLILANNAAGSIEAEAVREGIAEARWTNVIILCLLAGFGIKAGAIPLHVWLPLAHPVAPTAASAVLSGAMIKAGLLGWMRFLPIGQAELPDWGVLLIVLSMTAAFAGVLIGLTQEDPKTLLAYSSISQMGFIASAIAIAMAAPDAREMVMIGTAVYVLHHGLVKGALFLGVGVAHETGDDPLRQRLVMLGLIVVSLSLSGAPLMTGALAKVALKEGIHAGPEAWYAWLDWLLPLAAAGTTVLMGRFLWLIWRNELGHVEHGQFRGMAIPWGALVVVVFPVVWLAPAWYRLEIHAGAAFEPSNLWTATWPVLAGGAILLLLWWLIARAKREVPVIHVPAGDLLIPMEWALAGIRPSRPGRAVPHPPDPVASLGASWYGLFAEARAGSRTSRFGRWMVRWDVSGILFVAISLVIVVLMIW